MQHGEGFFNVTNFHSNVAKQREKFYDYGVVFRTANDAVEAAV